MKPLSALLPHIDTQRHMSNTTRLTTPPVELRWARLYEPNTRFASASDPRGTYEVLCVFDPANNPAHKNFLDDLRAEWDHAYEETCRREKKQSVKTHDYPWNAMDGEDAGKIGLRPKNKESFKDKEGNEVAVQIAVVDAKKQRIRVDIGNGTIGRVSFDVNPFYTANKFGLQLRLKAVQVLSLVEYGDDFGFEEDEAGYVGVPVPKEEPKPRAAAPSPEPEPKPEPEFNFAAKKDEDDLPFD